MMIEDSAHYRFPGEGVAKEWEAANPGGTGTYHTDTQLSLYVSMVHQYHCVQTFGEQLTKTKRHDWSHLQHCLNYLREMALCTPDMTLERGDFTKRNFTTEHGGALHVCRNLDPTYDLLAKNWAEWISFRKNLGK
jgi:hypothetical protein